MVVVVVVIVVVLAAAATANKTDNGTKTGKGTATHLFVVHELGLAAKHAVGKETAGLDGNRRQLELIDNIADGVDVVHRRPLAFVHHNLTKDKQQQQQQRVVGWFSGTP